jgi:hypothetical protein
MQNGEKEDGGRDRVERLNGVTIGQRCQDAILSGGIR